MKAAIYVRKRKRICYLQISISDGFDNRGNRNRTILSTNLKVDSKFWNSKSKKVKGVPYSDTINKELYEKLTFIQNLIYRHYGDPDFGINELVNEFDTKYHRRKISTSEKSNKKPLSFLDHVEQYLNFVVQSGKYKTQSIKSKKKSYHAIKKCFELNNVNPSLDDISIVHWDMVENYCINKLRLENVTVNNHRKELNVWMNYFNKYELTTNNFHKKIPKLNSPQKKYPVLLPNEVNLIKSLQEHDSELDYYRFLMLFQIETGLRVGDLFSISEKSVDYQNKLLNVITSKNKSNIKIPLPDYLYDLMVENDFIFKNRSPKEFNKAIKIICKKAGIDSPIETIKYVGSKQIRKYKPKYMLITSHSLRRTMITNNLKKGISVEMLMKIVGTKDRTVFQKYIQFSDDDAINELRRIQKEE